MVYCLDQKRLYTCLKVEAAHQAYHAQTMTIGDTEKQGSEIMREVSHQTPRGITVSRVTSKLPYRKGFGRFLRELDEYRGIYLSSGYEYPGRYSRWDIVSVRPPLELIAFQREVTFRPLNERGIAINRMFAGILRDLPCWADFREDNGTLHATLQPMPAIFP